MLRLKLLPAAHGDAIWIEHGDPKAPRRIVIDGGPAPMYQQGLRKPIAKMPNGVEGGESRWANWLQLNEVVAFARRRVVEDALAGGECSIPTLRAVTGLDIRVVKQTLEELQTIGAVLRLRGGRIDRFVLVPA